mmetsp:Transcript_19879/g.53183  ORF Transcript_19879/g.53183 Transcript_19879/m.53183 type:complete len:290 (-) Transcript_19879:1016-1885(-)
MTALSAGCGTSRCDGEALCLASFKHNGVLRRILVSGEMPRHTLLVNETVETRKLHCVRDGHTCATRAADQVLQNVQVKSGEGLVKVATCVHPELVERELAPPVRLSHWLLQLWAPSIAAGCTFLRQRGREALVELTNLRLDDVKCRGNVLHGCTEDHGRHKHYGDRSSHKEIAVLALVVSAIRTWCSLARDTQRERESNGTSETAEPHHNLHILRDLPASLRIQHCREWEDVRCPGKDAEHHRDDGEREVPMKSPNGQGHDHSQVDEHAGFRQHGQCPECHLRRNLRGL